MASATETVTYQDAIGMVPRDRVRSLSNIYDSMDTGDKNTFLFDKMGDFFSRTSSREVVDVINEKFTTWHRTLQQNAFRAMVNFCTDKYAGTKYFDARNEESVRFCKMLKGLEGGNVIKDLAGECDAMRSWKQGLVESCDKMEKKYKNPLVIDACKDIRSFKEPESCKVARSMRSERLVPYGFPLI